MRSTSSPRPGPRAAGPRRAAASNRLLAVGLAVAVFLCAEPACGEALLCGRSVVLPGDTAAAVLRKCGAPTHRQSLRSAGAAAKRSGRSPAPRRRAGSGGRGSGNARGSGGGGSPEVWTYDLGSRQLVRFLTFERGRLVRIDFGGYGR